MDAQEFAPDHDSPLAANLPDPLTPRQWGVVREHLDLTERELQIVRGIVCGQSDVEIIATLGMARSTLRTHVSHIFKKCGTRKRVSIAVKALEPFFRCWQ